jgi:hypothetical protein
MEDDDRYQGLAGFSETPFSPAPGILFSKSSVLIFSTRPVRATPKTACPYGSSVSFGRILTEVRRNLALKALVSSRISAIRASLQ